MPALRLHVVSPDAGGPESLPRLQVAAVADRAAGQAARESEREMNFVVGDRPHVSAVWLEVEALIALPDGKAAIYEGGVEVRHRVRNRLNQLGMKRGLLLRCRKVDSTHFAVWFEPKASAK